MEEIAEVLENKLKITAMLLQMSEELDKDIDVRYYTNQQNKIIEMLKICKR